MPINSGYQMTRPFIASMRYITVELLRQVNIIDVLNGSKPTHVLRNKFFDIFNLNCNKWIKDIIFTYEDKLEPITLSKSFVFVFDVFRNRLYKKYSASVVNFDGIKQLEEHVYDLPSSVCSVQGEYVERIYKQIMDEKC